MQGALNATDVDRSAALVTVGNPDGNSIDTMWAANGAYLAMAIINWILMFGKYFYYVYFGIGFAAAMNLVTTIMTGDIMNLEAALTTLVARLTWPTPCGLLLGTLLNLMVNSYVMAFYMSSEEMTNPKMGAWVRMCDGFFWVWIILGGGKPVLMAMDWFFGTKKFDILDAYTQLALFEIVEYVVTLMILIIFRGPIISFYNTK